MQGASLSRRSRPQHGLLIACPISLLFPRRSNWDRRDAKGYQCDCRGGSMCVRRGGGNVHEYHSSEGKDGCSKQRHS